MQAFVRVLDQQVADRKAASLGLGSKPLGQLCRDDHGAADAIVALPDLVGRLRQAAMQMSRCVRRSAPRVGRPLDDGKDRALASVLVKQRSQPAAGGFGRWTTRGSYSGAEA
jgi:hypothetical protein